MGAFSVTLGWTLQPYLQEGLQRNRVGGACDYRPLIYLCVNVWVWGHLYVSVSMRREVVVVCYFDVCVLLEMKNLSFYLSKCAWLRSTAVDFVIFLFYKQKSINFFSFCLTEHLFCQKKKKKSRLTSIQNTATHRKGSTDTFTPIVSHHASQAAVSKKVWTFPDVRSDKTQTS